MENPTRFLALQKGTIEHFHMSGFANRLGDIRAEFDSKMLSVAFYETPDYRTLLEGTERPIVVGRRGSGKSALRQQLARYWKKEKGTLVLEVVPEEDQVIGVRPLLELFGSRYNQIKAGARIAWKYALLLESALQLQSHWKFTKAEGSPLLATHTERWRKLGLTVCGRFRSLLQNTLTKGTSPEAVIGSLAQTLELHELQAAISSVLTEIKSNVIILVDQLDEGYEPDNIGSAFVAGFVQAVIDLNHQVSPMRAYVFLRDNLFKSIGKLDPDYSKNIEGRYLRLHWDEAQLFELVCARLRVTSELNVDSNRKLWNRFTADGLQEMAGFERCLQLTLYRPRDVLSLLNDAFLAAHRHKRSTLILQDVESTAKETSETRLDDLIKEYSMIIPSLKSLCGAFRELNPEISYSEAINRVEQLFQRSDMDAASQREFAIFENAQEGIRLLYGVGFLGIKDTVSKSFVFCHDGRSPNREFLAGDRLLIHPCYWIALNATRNTLEADEAAEIHDEYEVEVYSEAKDIRDRRIGQLHSKFDRIPIGHEGAGEFEEWCLKALKICFSGPLRNFEHHPNGSAPQRRDVVATNQSERGLWRQILDDYKARQVLFEMKNKRGLEPDDFRQIHSYLHDEYGRIGFIVTRDEKHELFVGPELDWVRELHNKHRVIVIKLTGKFLCSMISKLRSVAKLEKGDPCEHALSKLLDVYVRSYLTGSKAPKTARDRNE